MCGIAGYLDLRGRPAAPATLSAMAMALAHRGPDDEGTFTDGPLGFAHRRLSVLDLTSAGHQPMQTSDGRYTIVYNGEVYNFPELRRELERLGHEFRSRTDAEVVLCAYAQWGADAVLRFNGMFAFAIWDSIEHALFLARDRYGIKPLYLAETNGVLIFASEVKAILAHPAYRIDLDREALLEYFTFQNYFSGRTLFRGVRLMPAGSWLHVPLSAASVPAPRRYWDFAFQEPERPVEEGACAEELDRLFQQAVRRQLVSDVPIGGFLSSGMDSGAITSVAASFLPWMRTFTCGFDLHSVSGLEIVFDEREKAEHMSYLFRTEHYEMVLKAGDMERVLPYLVFHLEEPRVGQSYPNFYISQLASKFVKVALAGTGGDELFGGYPWRYYRAVVNADFEDYIDKYYLYWQRLIDNRHIKRVFQPIWGDVGRVWTRDLFRDVFTTRPPRLARPEDYVNQSLYFEAKTFLHGLLVVEDKLSMAHGLETRVPFLDNDLVDFAQRLPVRFKLGSLTDVVRLNENVGGAKIEQYFQKTRDGKLLLRRVMERHIPAEVTRAVKQGFSAPDASWFKGESVDYVRRVVFDDHACIYDYLDPEPVRELVSQHLAGEVNRRLFIWSLLNVEWWLRTFLPRQGDNNAVAAAVREATGKAGPPA